MRFPKFKDGDTVVLVGDYADGCEEELIMQHVVDKTQFVVAGSFIDRYGHDSTWCPNGISYLISKGHREMPVSENMIALVKFVLV